jgi:SNF2 family DNA or RNA helicase
VAIDLNPRGSGAGPPLTQGAARDGATSATPGLPVDFAQMLDRLEQGEPISASRSEVVAQALGLWGRPGFETFVCLDRLRFEPFDYQLRAASAVLRRMHGRAILADEVGLGKTIEAGLVLLELRMRMLGARTLVVAPAGLVGQWHEELTVKFGLPTISPGAGASLPTEAGDWPVIVASLASARRPRLRDVLSQISWDLVIVDEAHRLKRPRSASAQLVRALPARSLLLLTATPVENRLDDLYQLVSLVKPGHLGSPTAFRAHHGGTRSPQIQTSDADLARDLPGLRRALREVMVRHRRSEVALMLPRRLARTLRVHPDPEEAALYHDVSERVREEARKANSAKLFGLRVVQRLAGSSARALAPTLAKYDWPELAERAAGIAPGAKARRLVEICSEESARGEKVVVFTAFRESLAELAELAQSTGLEAVVYHGGLSRRDKEAAIGSFADDTQLLLTTEAAGEGRNLQFCHLMVNFDLPWNPMQIEQRLGRLHRIGQTHEVIVTNLVSAGTLEDRILEVLEAKLHLFELVVGELDMVLGRVSEDFDFESSVFATHLAAVDGDDLSRRLDLLGDELAAARSTYLADRERNDAFVAPAGEEDLAGQNRS